MVAMVLVVGIVVEDAGEVIPRAHSSSDLTKASYLLDHCLTPCGRVCHAWIVPGSLWVEFSGVSVQSGTFYQNALTISVDRFPTPVDVGRVQDRS